MQMRIQRGGNRGSGPPRKSQNIGFFNTGPHPLKIVKLPSQLSILGHNRHASKSSFKWGFAGGPKTAR